MFTFFYFHITGKIESNDTTAGQSEVNAEISEVPIQPTSQADGPASSRPQKITTVMSKKQITGIVQSTQQSRIALYIS